MRHYETSVQELKDKVLTAVARLAWNDKLQGKEVLDIPEEIIPGPEAQMRCCIYKERAIVGSRVKMAMGGDRANPNLVEVLPICHRDQRGSVLPGMYRPPLHGGVPQGRHPH